MHLFSPLTLRDVTFPNRIGISPMCQYRAHGGLANDWHLVHLGSRAVGGAGMVMVEATAVEERGRITLGDMGLWTDAHAEPLARIARFLVAQGSVPAIQLAHAGRKGSTQIPWEGSGALPLEQGGWIPVAPGTEAFSPPYPVPTALTTEDLRAVVQAFAEAGRRALAAGFRVLEVHAAHGYLLHEFYSPLSNFRQDGYGGSFENRTRLLREVVAALRALDDGFALFVRVSATDWTPGGWTGDDTVALARTLKAAGVDCLDCSTGGNVPDTKIPLGPGYQVPFAERVRKEARLASAAVGLITDPAQAQQILADGQADLVLLAREALRDPYFALHAASELGADVAWPVPYERARPRPTR